MEVEHQQVISGGNQRWCEMEVDTTLDNLEIMEIVQSFFGDCLSHPELLYHERIQSLRKFIQRKEEGILDSDALCTNTICFPLNSYEKKDIGTRLFSDKWCLIKSTRWDNKGRLHLRWEPKKKFLNLLEIFVSCCNETLGEEDLESNLGVLEWTNQFLDKLKRKRGRSQITERIPEKKGSTSSAGDATTEYSTSSVTSGEFMLHSEGFQSEDGEVVYVTLKDLKLLQKFCKKNGCSSTSDESSLRSSSEEKTIPYERDRSSSPEIEQSNVDPLRAFYQIFCCSRQYRCLKDLTKHLRQKHRIGITKTGTKRCKICASDVSVQLLMIHIELYHEYLSKGAYSIKITKSDIEPEPQMELVKIS